MYDGSFEIEKIRAQNEVLESDVAQLEIDLAEAQGQLIGVGQVWQDVKASRSTATSYQNTTGRSIGWQITFTDGSSGALAQVSEDNSTWFTFLGRSGSHGFRYGTFILIPPNHYYRINTSADMGVVSTWQELR